MCHRRIPFVAILLVAIFSVAADKKPGRAKEPASSAAQIQLWVKQLSDESFKVREEATRDLIKAGEAALDAVSKATKSKDAEVKQRALRIIQHPEKVAEQKKQAAIAYFKELEGKVAIDAKRPGKPVIGLYLMHTEITDAGLVHLKKLAKLQKLYLDNTRITDAGLVHLKGFTELQTLFLWNTKITDAGLVHLKGFTNLQWLNLDHTKVTDAGLEHLKGLANLQLLYLMHTKITDAGLVHLKGLTSLRALYLDNTKVTDAGLEHLKGLANLQWLNLDNTRITDAGLVHLKGLTSLRVLYLGYTKVTKAGIEKLQKALPECKIALDEKKTKQKQKAQ